MISLSYALGILGGPAFLRWLQDVHGTTLQDGARLVHLWPPGVNRSPADASRCIEAAEHAGAIQRVATDPARPQVGYTNSTSLLAWQGLQFGGKHPSRREPWVEPVERLWEPGPDRALLATIADLTWDEIREASDVWKGWPT